jgi:NAD(P)H-hydrate repair Nnr-like enzyme with NAD(P)H-hydrate epimerase domain
MGNNTDLYTDLLSQCIQLNIPVWTDMAHVPARISNDQFDVIVDGVFGFSFKSAGGIRPPYNDAIQVRLTWGTENFLPFNFLICLICFLIVNSE